MKLQEYVETKRKIKPNQAIVQRWESRIVPRSLQLEGKDGAIQYLTDYGKSIAAPKVIMLARQAELSGFPEMAAGFWEKAYELETGCKPDGDLSNIVQMENVLGIIENRIQGLPPIKEFPFNLQPGKLVPMQPVDAQHDREYYITNPRYWGQPKRDGEKLIIFATPIACYYQSRSMRLRNTPSKKFDQALKDVAVKWGSFILEGEQFFIDVEDKEHQSGATCAARNIELGQATVKPVMRYSAFTCLYTDMRPVLEQDARVNSARFFMDALIEKETDLFEVMPTARTTEEKQALVDKQFQEGREGEVWAIWDMPYHPDKSTDDSIVRTKYLTEPTPYVITGVQPTTAEGHVIGGFDVSNLEGKPVGTVGTGYTRAEQAEILRRHNENPGKVLVLVVSRGFTVYGKLREGRFEGWPD